MSKSEKRLLMYSADGVTVKVPGSPVASGSGSGHSALKPTPQTERRLL